MSMSIDMRGLKSHLIFDLVNRSVKEFLNIYLKTNNIKMYHDNFEALSSFLVMNLDSKIFDSEHLYDLDLDDLKSCDLLDLTIDNFYYMKNHSFDEKEMIYQINYFNNDSDIEI